MAKTYPMSRGYAKATVGNSVRRNISAAQQSKIDAARKAKMHAAGISMNLNRDECVAEDSGRSGQAKPYRRGHKSGTLTVSKGPMKVGKRRSTVSVNQNYGVPLTSSSHQESSPAIRGDEHLALVVMRTSGRWGYVRIRTHDIDVTDTPQSLIPVHQAGLFADLWKRIVQHGAIPWTDEVFMDTVRIVKFNMALTDCTFDVLGVNAGDLTKNSALSKLTMEEADALGLGQEKRKQSILHDPKFNVRDKKLLSDLQDVMVYYDLDVELEYLK